MGDYVVSAVTMGDHESMAPNCPVAEIRTSGTANPAITEIAHFVSSIAQNSWESQLFREFGSSVEPKVVYYGIPYDTSDDVNKDLAVITAWTVFPSTSTTNAQIAPKFIRRSSNGFITVSQAAQRMCYWRFPTGLKLRAGESLILASGYTFGAPGVTVHRPGIIHVEYTV